ncbi:MAG: helix-turn-helix domain-containing protein [Arenimonas sp.]|uniref:ArsR/SmtB family transcription factor n=1 Tax=Arenimonas sp. TaxID=1872635 RepID=UPI0025BB9DB0|nr:helix-turn-helix domain-containing protein [Arenimonas sp.]MBW8367119.1 helix-turn-helix domain-containing protein [Arenimonas sp.]
MAERNARRTIQDTARIDPALLRVLANPVRSFIVYSLAPEAKTAKTLAAELGCPTTRLYYHLRQLEKHGLVFVERTRLVSGIVEKHYRAVARDLRLDTAAFGTGDKPDRRRTEALLGFVFDQTRVEISRGIEAGQLDVRRRAPDPGALMAYRNVLKLSPEQAQRLYARLQAFWMEYDDIAKQPAADGRFYAFTVALYPNDVAAVDKPAPAPPRRKPRRP